MRVSNVRNNVAFGTRPQIGDFSIQGLTKYNKNLAKGILLAFDELAQNGVDDELVINIGIKRDAKKLTTDSMEVSYFKNENKWEKIYTQRKIDNELVGNGVNISKVYGYKSSVSLSPNRLQKLTPEGIRKKIIEVYQGLLNSSKKVENRGGYPKFTGFEKVSKEQEQTINELLDKYSFDDFTCA